MRKFLLILIFIAFISGCSTSIVNKKYTVIVETESKAIIGSGTDSHEMKFDIKAKDDIEAYRKGADYYGISIKTYNQNEDNTYHPRPVKFEVRNDVGLNIVPLLSQNIKDSINKIVFAELLEPNGNQKEVPVANEMKNPYLDTAGDGDSPVKITSARFIEKEYSNYKSVRLSYRNISGKKIDAIKFRWYGTNAFGDPAECGSYSDIGLGGGFTDDPLGAGNSDYGIWDILSKDGKTIKRAWVTEVAFHDGTKWEHE